MSSVNNIQISDIKHVLGYAVKNRRGYRHDINFFDGKLGHTVESFVNAGFIHTGQTLNYKTWSITNLGDKYYKDLFGNYSYYKNRFFGFFNRILNMGD